MTSKPGPTDLDTERREQARWRPRVKWRKARIFDQLLVNEFADPSAMETYLGRQLAGLVRFAAQHVPHYRERWRELGITPDDVRGLGDAAKIPVLTRTDIQEKGVGLIAEGGLRPIDRGAYDTKTSGSTGQSVTVRHSRIAGMMRGFLKQREYRWFRTDPREAHGQYFNGREPSGQSRRRPRRHRADNFVEIMALRRRHVQDRALVRLFE